MPVLAFLAKIAASPVVAGLLLPALRGALTDFLNRMADQHERAAATKAAKSARTAEELRDASRKLSDSSRRR